MDNPEKLATRRRKPKQKHNTTQYKVDTTRANKHKQRKLDKGHHTNVCII
jgi:hypothetical protein